MTGSGSTENLESADPVAWLERFRDANGRPLRVLHIGNIANNAYNNAKIQRRFGIEADVLCHNYYHIMACPEWEDADFSGDFGDSFFPDWSAVDLRGFERPRWFAQGPIDGCVRYLISDPGDRALREERWRALSFERWAACRKGRIGKTVRRALAGMSLALQADRPAGSGESGIRSILALRKPSWWKARILVAGRRVAWRAMLAILATIGRHQARSFLRTVAVASRGSASLFERWFTRRAVTLIGAEKRMAPFLAEDRVAAARSYVGAFWHPLLRTLFGRYDVVQAYATYTIMPYLAGRRDYVAYEHGTIRSIPFQDTVEGQLCMTTYRAAAAVLVTNSDNLPAAARMGLPGRSVVCLPHAFDSDKLERFAERYQPAPSPNAAISLFFSPSRQHWVDGDPGWAKGNDRVIRALRLLRERGIPCRLRLVEWGNDLDATRRLVAELGVSDMVEWVAPMKKRELWAQYLDAGAVIDQFVVPALGGVTFEAMMLGCRVITAIDASQTLHFFGEEPPVFRCSTPVEIASAMAEVIADPADSRGCGEANRNWMRKYHSARRIIEIQAATYRGIVEQAAGAKPADDGAMPRAQTAASARVP